MMKIPFDRYKTIGGGLGLGGTTHDTTIIPASEGSEGREDTWLMLGGGGV